MARIVIGAYLVRYPLGGMINGTLGWLHGLAALGHDVYVVERSLGSRACYNPARREMTDDCEYGVSLVGSVLDRRGFDGHWCFVDAEGIHHGLNELKLGEILRSADLFIGMLWQEWLGEVADCGVRVFVDGEPAYFQMQLAKGLKTAAADGGYEYYYTSGLALGTSAYTGPTAGLEWRTVISPIPVSRYTVQPIPSDAPFTTVMNWRSHGAIEFDGVGYGQKDVEFEKFMDLPGRTSARLEVAASGRVPRDRLLGAGWQVRNADEVARTVESYLEYLATSRGEFSVAKNVFVATNSGEFSERSGCYLASGRPVVAQETGFSDHVPCGRGLFAVRDAEEAVAALEQVNGDYLRHSRWAREIAEEYLDAPKVMRRFLTQIGL
jgi:hypothetical protein